MAVGRQVRASPRIPVLTLCLITDRRRLAAAGPLDPTAALLEQLRGAAAGGIDVVQVRERDLDDRGLLRLLRACRVLLHKSPVRLVVNDRIDLALVSGAAGVHLRAAGVAPSDARRLADRPWMVGKSVHTPAQAAAARSADYLIAASVFAPGSKPGQEATLGLAGLRAVVEAAGGCPVWALGGITAARAPVVAAAGVRGLAAISAFIPPPGRTDIADFVSEVAQKLRFSFDSSHELP